MGLLTGATWLLSALAHDLRLAEREGFEPPSLAAGRFQGGCIRPLCHRSGPEDTGLHSEAPRRGARAAEWGALLRR
jgi:hypothetical protein